MRPASSPTAADSGSLRSDASEEEKIADFRREQSERPTTLDVETMPLPTADEVQKLADAEQ